MAHQVKCYYCATQFDRDKEAYAQISTKRYAHAACALREAAKNSDKSSPTIIDPTVFVNCIYCKQTFNRENEPCKIINENKYAHQKCFELEQKRELTDKEKLERYIMKLFNTDYVYARIQRQITEFIEKYNYTYSGIHKALVYYYEVKGNSIEKANGGIGIIPYIYQNAYNYYYAIWEAQQKQECIISKGNLENYIPKIIEVKIPLPQRQEKKRKLFSFLDEEVDNGQ